MPALPTISQRPGGNPPFFPDLIPPCAAWAHMEAQDPAHGGPGSSSWGLRLLPAGIWTSQPRDQFSVKKAEGPGDASEPGQTHGSP